MKKIITILIVLFSFSSLFSQDDFIQSPYQNIFINTFTLADFNGDGYTDIFGIDLKFSTPSDLDILINQGGASIGFNEIELFSAYGAVGEPSAGDYDGDGDMDIVLSKGENADLYILINDGNASFESVLLGVSGATRLQFEDLEGDGDLDIIGINPSSHILDIYLNDGNQNYSRTNILTSNDNLVHFASGDIDGDGDIDIVIGFNEYSGNQVVAYKNNGNNNFEEVVLIVDFFDYVRGISIADLNNDGQNDIAVINGDDYVGWINQGDFSFEMIEFASFSSAGIGYVGMTIVDCDGNGVPDAVIGTGGGVDWYKNTSTDPIMYEEREVGGVQTAYNSASADFDLDGDIDLICSNGDLWWFENNIEQTIFADEDQDGFNSDEDCDDTNPDINPDAIEIANNDIDENCDGILLIIDEDEDGFNSDEDCDDTNPDINPDAIEIANNGIDEDCDGMDLISGVHQLANVSLEIFPNPTDDYINIKVNGDANFSITLFDINGKILLSGKNVKRVDITPFSSGVYILKINDLNSNQSILERIIVEK